MNKIQVGQNLFTLVDDEDYEYLIQWQWHFNGGYVVRHQKLGEYKTGETRRKIHMHRVIMQTPKDSFTDHINHNPLDNCRSNLRVVTSRQNQMNKRATENKTSRYKGVYRNLNNSKNWVALIDGMYIGSFSKEQWAAMAYDINAKTIYGEYAQTNFQ